ncbi:MAG: CPBP family intramembrane metalloprotease [Pirellulaceae bacterium]|nr:CPBP family intramembrane metalloprotease [Pirellulaceae bacterium]
MQQAIYDFIAVPWRDEQRRQREFLNSPEAERADWQVIWVTVTAAVALTLQYYGSTAGRFLYDTIVPEAVDGAWARQMLWAADQTLLYTLVPWCTVRFALRRPIGSYGLSRRGIGASAWIYLAMYLVMVPAILWFSGSARFQQTYPFYHPPAGEPIWPKLIAWELLYAVQFVALEFFFRGYLVHGLKQRFGPYAIFAAMVPYCMIHFGKPLPETLGAIVAGIVLGFMSLKTRSIWWGAALHIAIAWTMDAAALWTQW